jgi:hypothetical protein
MTPIFFSPSLTTTAGLSIEMFKAAASRLGWEQGVEYQFEVRLLLQSSIDHDSKLFSFSHQHTAFPPPPKKNPLN